MPTRFNSLLEKNQGGIADILRHITLLRYYNGAVSTCLGFPASNHCSVANATANMLVLHTDSSAWAAKLRYLTPSILEYLRNECELPSIKSIRIRVQPKQTEPQTNSLRKTKISSKTASFLNQVADSTSDQQIRSCYLKLAQNNRS